MGRKIGAWAIGLIALAGVASLSLGDVLVAWAQPDLALRLPGNSSLPATAILPTLAKSGATKGKIDQREARALSLRALLNSPLSSAALVYLAALNSARSDPAAAIELLKLSGGTGWHDEAAQRQLYNAALLEGDVEEAVRHADALLRQGKASAELFPQFDRGASIPEFQMALSGVIASSPGWPPDYLVKHGPLLEDGALIAFAKARARRSGGLERTIAAPLVSTLANRGRVNAALTLWQLVPGSDGHRAGILRWPDEGALRNPTPFDWSLGEGYIVEGGGTVEDRGGAVLSVASTMAGGKASRLLALAPGRYAMRPRGAGRANGNWRWEVSCGTAGASAYRALSNDSVFQVPQGCPIQRLVLAATVEPGQEPPRLAELMVSVSL